jgi:hypothetical protein
MPAAEAVLPTCGSFELNVTNAWTFDQTPRAHNMSYFVKTLEAEKYAKLLGRPQSQPRTECGTLKLENLQKRERGWQRYSSHIKDRNDLNYCCDWSVISSEPNSPVSYNRTRMYRSLSAISTAASDEGSVRSDREPALSKASRLIFNAEKEAEQRNATWIDEEDPDCGSEDCSPRKVHVPLGIRRVMASMIPEQGLSEEGLSRVQAALSVSMQKLPKNLPARPGNKNVRARATTALQRQRLSSPSRRNASAPSLKRPITREEIEGGEMVAVAG